MKAIIVRLLGPFMLVMAMLVLPFTATQNAAAGIALWMIVWWSTQSIPIGATSLLPLLLFPAFGVLDFKAAATNYANPIIYLFLGGFVIGLAIEKWNIHTRIALLVLRNGGERASQVVAGFMAAAALLSMWISNTAATVMMLPIGLSVIALLKEQFASKVEFQRFAICLLLGLAFAANVGGMATLIGTPPNLVLAGIVFDQLGIELGFGTWMLFAMPIVLLLFFLILFVNTRIIYRLPSIRMVGLRESMGSRLGEMGKMGRAERKVAIVFMCTAALWIFKDPLSKLPGLDFLSDAVIGIAGALAMFVVPDGKGGELMEWKDMQRMPWDILLLFGGGLAIAAGLSASGLVELMGAAIQNVSGVEWLWIVLLITAIAVFLTELMSNVALVSMLLPIAVGVAPGLGGHALELAIPLTLGASCAFMLPIATPPNAIVFAGSYLRMSDMMRAGVWLNIVSIILITLYCMWMVPLIFGV